MIDSMEGVWLPEQLKPSSWEGEPVQYVQPKHDGWRLLLAMQEDPSNGLLAFGRKREPHLELSHLLGHLPWFRSAEKNMTALSAIDGELWVPGEPSTFLPTALKTGDERLTFTPFCVPFQRGTPLESFADAKSICEDCGLKFVQTINFDCVDVPKTREGLVRQARRSGLEGWVLKESHLSGWYKVKVTRTADVVCTGYREGRGKYIGECGALIGSVGDREVVACSGMQDWQRVDISLRDVGRVFEVEYDNVGANGKLTRPRFVRWRDDKPASECTEEQLHGTDGVTVLYEGETVRSGTYRGKRWRAVDDDGVWKFVEKDGERLSWEDREHVRGVLTR